MQRELRPYHRLRAVVAWPFAALAWWIVRPVTGIIVAGFTGAIMFVDMFSRRGR